VWVGLDLAGETLGDAIPLLAEVGSASVAVCSSSPRPLGPFEYNVSAMDVSAVARWRVVCLLMLGAFLGLSGMVYAVGLLPGDVAVHGEILEARGTLAHAAARWFDYGGKWVVLVPAMLLLFAWSPTARRHWWLWCAIMPIGGALEQLFKFLVARPRPRGVNWGFPSGHVTAAATFAVLLLYVLSREPASPRVRVSLIVLAAALVGTVGYARIILNAHWPSDVLGGVLLGGGCAAAGAWWDSARGGKPAESARAADGAVGARG
jgi:membrane-associated phospholipid phosphatase